MQFRGARSRGREHEPFLLKATRSGNLYAEAREVSRSRKISTCTVQVTNDAGDLVSLFQGTAYIKDEPFPPQAKDA